MNNNSLAHQQMNTSTELYSKFFFTWSVLSGTAITLTIPLIFEIRKSIGIIEHESLILTALFLFFFSMILSLLRNLRAAKGFALFASINGGGKHKDTPEEELNSLSRKQLALEYFAISSFIGGSLLLYVFIYLSIIR